MGPEEWLCMKQTVKYYALFMYFKHVRLQPYTHYVTHTHIYSMITFLSGKRKPGMVVLTVTILPFIGLGAILPLECSVSVCVKKSWSSPISCCYCWVWKSDRQVLLSEMCVPLYQGTGFTVGERKQELHHHYYKLILNSSVFSLSHGVFTLHFQKCWQIQKYI